MDQKSHPDQTNHHFDKKGTEVPQESISGENVQEPQDLSQTEKKENLVTLKKAEYDELCNSLEDFKAKYWRTLAEIENVRKRLQKERDELVKHVISDVIVAFLQPIDNLENALKFVDNMTGEVKNWAVGFKMILSQFKEALAEQGIVAIEAEGKMFDPHFHEAMEMQFTSEYKPEMVIKEILKGYKMGERIIRPAKVIVAKASEQKVDNSSCKGKCCSPSPEDSQNKDKGCDCC